MQTRNIFIAFSLVSIFAIVVGMLVINPSPDIQDMPLDASQETSLQDGASVISSHCARCHSAELLKQTSQTRTEWENTLAKMEKMGVTLSDTEKAVLIDYLTGIDKP